MLSLTGQATANAEQWGMRKLAGGFESELVPRDDFHGEAACGEVRLDVGLAAAKSRDLDLLGMRIEFAADQTEWPVFGYGNGLSQQMERAGLVGPAQENDPSVSKMTGYDHRAGMATGSAVDSQGMTFPVGGDEALGLTTNLGWT